MRACRERGVLRLRLAHGRGKGVQRAAVRRRLASMSEVRSFEDAPPRRRGLGGHRRGAPPVDIAPAK